MEKRASQSGCTGTGEMHEMDSLLALAGRLGYCIRHVWLNGEGGGVCTVRDQKILFVDLGQTIEDQLALLKDAIAKETEANPAIEQAPHSADLEISECQVEQPTKPGLFASLFSWRRAG